MARSRFCARFPLLSSLQLLPNWNCNHAHNSESLSRLTNPKAVSHRRTACGISLGSVNCCSSSSICCNFAHSVGDHWFSDDTISNVPVLMPRLGTACHQML